MRKARVRGDSVREILLRRNMSQEDLAARVGITDGYVGHLLNGLRYPRPTVRLRLMHELGVDFDTLFEIVDPDVATNNGSH